MRIMAIDYGDAHTGIAVSDLTGLLAGYTTTIHSRRAEQVAAEVRRLAEEYGVTELVLGYPKNMDGTLGPRAEKAEAFKALLEETLGLRWSSGTSAEPPSTPTISWPSRGRTPKSARPSWTRWRRR